MSKRGQDGKDGHDGHDGQDFDERVLGEATGVGAPPPAPSPALLRTVGAMKPVRTRTRFGAAAIVALVGLVGPAVALVRGPLRRDLAALPIAWVIAAAALWATAATLSLVAALVPRRGDVLPAPSRASRLAGAVMAAVALFALFATIDVPGVSMLPAERGWTLFESCLHCIGTVSKVAAVVLVAGLLALRRLVPVGGSRVGMALGAAGGALGGLLLVFICPFASAAHVVGGHVTGMVLAAVVGAILMRVTAHHAVAIALLALMLATACAGPTAAGPPPALAPPVAPAAATGALQFGRLEGAGRPTDALDVYLQGTAAEPTFPGNYKRAAEIYAGSDARAMALLYGEMFRLLEPARSDKTAELMVGVYHDAVATKATGKGKDATATVSLAPRDTYVAVGPDGKPTTPIIALPLAIELAIGPALVAAHAQGLSLASLHKARGALVAAIAKPDSPFKDYKLPLLPWLTALDAAGHLEAYDHWLYGPAFPDEMKRYGQAHPKAVDAMTKWAEEHPLFWK